MWKKQTYINISVILIALGVILELIALITHPIIFIVSGIVLVAGGFYILFAKVVFSRSRMSIRGKRKGR